MINVSELMDDPDFAVNYKVIRSKGMWYMGRFKMAKQKILNFYGAVQLASPKDLEQLPEGDRIVGTMKFFCKTPNELYVTHEESEEYEGISDVVLYKRKKYKIIQVSEWNANGFCRAFGVLTD